MNYFISDAEFKALVPRFIPPFGADVGIHPVVRKAALPISPLPSAEERKAILKSAAAKMLGRPAPVPMPVPAYADAPVSFPHMPSAEELAVIIKASAAKMFSPHVLKPRAHPVVKVPVSVLSQASVEAWAVKLKSQAAPMVDRHAVVARTVSPPAASSLTVHGGAIATDPIFRKRMRWAELNALPPEQQIGQRLFQYALRQYAQSLTRDQDAAQDLCSTATVRAWSALNRGLYVQQGNVPFRAYVFMIARNVFFGEMRRKRWHTDVEDFDLLADHHLIALPTQENQALLLDPVLAAMEKLVPEYRNALLAIVGGASYDQAALELGVPVGTIKSRVARARSGLKQLLDPPMPE